ncbi:uncharacterized protein LOC108143180 [Drosophila elegans]|uniref:uncharacterized protein LOC108143180 n=1 Tax=Drosophila elegans TaxID=30023 RepID=UPI0007E6F5BF|nr:uncharacterized protein LOC108143180 [Drosophila elegans]
MYSVSAVSPMFLRTVSQYSHQLKTNQITYTTKINLNKIYKFCTHILNMRRSIAVRSMFLNCLRENASNMRLEHEDLGRRIAISLANSRKTLANIENMNLELQKMKITIHDALNTILVAEFDLEDQLDPKIVTRMFIDCDSKTNKPVQPAIEGNNSCSKPVDDSNAEQHVKTVSTQCNASMTEFVAVPKLKNATDDFQTIIPNSNLNDKEVTESANVSISHIDFE